MVPARQKEFTEENIFNNDPNRQIAMASNKNSAFTALLTGNPFWYQQFDLTQNRKLRGGQPIVDFQFSSNCGLYVTTAKAMIFQNDFASFPIDKFEAHYTLVFYLT